ncbi:capsule assembly Wzi family protein [Rhabdobacter roseus]|uniref:Capsule assembly Wzi family protein n=1 Tax=Rhabdobacter roseus TaxID=1655419 RepID=A0A840TRA0_9BACT|nr:capsule assembly Wzi family protein [Rhabdobacter roseus]MBB5284247.1 hypothetical protein [Rhabdobacter roseus]
MNKCVILLCFLLFSETPFVKAQPESHSPHPDSLRSWAELSTFLATDSWVPFWLHTNQFGIVPKQGSTLQARVGWEQQWRISGNASSKHSWTAGGGLEVVGNLNPNSHLLLPQAYGSVQYGPWELYVGRRKQWVGLADSTLSTGSYSWSGNALPLPRVQVGVTRFTPVPFTRQWVAFKGFYADGWFENNRPVTSELKLHQKALYIRLGKPTGKLKLYGGLNHQVQWGGRSPYLTDGNEQMPKGLNNYVRVITAALSRGRLDSTASDFDQENRVGNHLGSVDLAIEIDGYDANWFLYRQSLYEDGSLYYLTNIADGLNGLRIRRKNNFGAAFSIREIVFEGLYTKSQGGADFIITKDKKRGRDNYFNNAQVRDGWSYLDRGIGTPFIPPTSDTRWRWPNYGDAFTSNNRVWVFHLGVRGTLLQKIEWSTKLSYSSNGGTYDLAFDPPEVYQFSGILNLQSKVNWLGGGATVFGSLAADVGDLYPVSYGVRLGLRKDGLLGQ